MKKHIQFSLEPDVYKKAKMKLIENDQTWQSFCEEKISKLISESVDGFGIPEEISEMANLGPKLTGGLPKVIHIWHQGEDKKGPHGPRIKASFYSDRFDTKENVSISISDDPKIVGPKDFKFNKKFTQSDFKKIREWIIEIKYKLIQYWKDSSITVDDIVSE